MRSTLLLKVFLLIRRVAVPQERRTLHKLRVRNGVIGADQMTQGLSMMEKPGAPAFTSIVASSQSGYAGSEFRV